MQASEQTLVHPIDTFNDSHRELFVSFINDFKNMETLSDEFKQELLGIRNISKNGMVEGFNASIKRKNLISCCFDEGLYNRFVDTYEDGCGLIISLNLVELFLRYNKNIFNELIDFLTEHNLYDITCFTYSSKTKDEKIKIQTDDDPNVCVVGLYDFTEEGKQHMISIFGDRFPFDVVTQVTVLNEFNF